MTARQLHCFKDRLSIYIEVIPATLTRPAKCRSWRYEIHHKSSDELFETRLKNTVVSSGNICQRCDIEWCSRIFSPGGRSSGACPEACCTPWRRRRLLESHNGRPSGASVSTTSPRQSELINVRSIEISSPSPTPHYLDKYLLTILEAPQLLRYVGKTSPSITTLQIQTYGLQKSFEPFSRRDQIIFL